MSATGLREWANLTVPGGDGTLLATDAHVPPADQWPVPVVVTRTPYSRSSHLSEGRAWRRRGFGYVVQDVRGRYDSDGSWLPYRNERGDGGALIDWITAQPWCNGQIIGYGGSYSGYTAWTMAVQRPDDVAAVVSLGPSMGLHRTKFTPSGILRLAEHAGWWLERADARTSREGLRQIVFSQEPDLLAHLPVAEIADLLGARLPGWGDTLDLHPAQVPPEALTLSELEHLPVAAMHVAGWFDLLLEQTLDLWQQVGRHHAPRPARQLIIGPWGHDLGLAGTTRTGAREHGPESVLPFGQRVVDWLEQVLERPGRSPADTVTTPSQARKTLCRADVFALGANRWLTRTDWPAVAGCAILHTGPGHQLTSTRAPQREALRFDYNPMNPFPSCLPGADRQHLNNRVDAARFSTDPLPDTLWIDGIPVVELAAETTGDGTDWVIRLLEAMPDGRVLELAVGSTVSEGPGPIRRSVALTPILARIAPGTRLILEITSSDFPHLARHLNSGPDRYRTQHTTLAHQTVHIGGPDGTAITLPVPSQVPPDPVPDLAPALGPIRR